MRSHDDDNFPWGGEPLLHDGTIVGRTTSAAYGYQGNKPVAMATTELPDASYDVIHKDFELEVASRLNPIDVRFVSLN